MCVRNLLDSDYGAPCRVQWEDGYGAFITSLAINDLNGLYVIYRIVTSLVFKKKKRKKPNNTLDKRVLIFSLLPVLIKCPFTRYVSM